MWKIYWDKLDEAWVVDEFYRTNPFDEEENIFYFREDAEREADSRNSVLDQYSPGTSGVPFWQESEE